MLSDWSQLFQPGAYRWRMGLVAADARAFFAPSAEAERLLAERAQWLADAPEEYAGFTPAGVPLLAEALELARQWGAPVAGESVESLGLAWEPDFVLLSPGPGGFIVAGGAVCFPTGWALRQKLGHSLFETHAPVPQLNTELAANIETALRRLAPRAAWARHNWGLARTSDLNLHPRREVPTLDASAAPAEVFLRVERQLLLKLPETGGILFGIRIEVVPLRELMRDAPARQGLRDALVSMPADIAAYKRLDGIRPAMIAWCAGER
jgi:hypothetical protein